MAVPPVSGVAGTAGVNAAQSVVPKPADGFGDSEPEEEAAAEVSEEG